MFVSILISLLFLTLTTSASVKREEYSSSSSSSNNPVYSPSSSSSYLNSVSSSGGANSASNGNLYLTPNFNYGSQSASNDHISSQSANNFQTNPSSQGNLYYYYYPVQEKPKESTFQTSASNQYSSSVSSPNNGESSPSDNQPGNGQDLNYGAQGENNYNGQGELYNGQSGSNNNYDQSISNIASQLQQYNYGAGPTSNVAYSPSASQYAGASSVYGPGSAYGLAGDGSGSAYSAANGLGAGPAPGANSLSGSNYPSISDSSNAYASLANSLQGYANVNGQSGLFNPQSSPYAPYAGFGNYAASSAPQPSYEAASSSSSSGLRKYGIGSIIMPMLALAGLSLLIPTVTSLTTAAGRKKRSVDPAKESALGDYLERIDRYYALYKSAIERDECMNRIICELGDSMGFVRGRAALLNFAEKYTPIWLSKRIGALKQAASTTDKPGKCKKYSCH